MLIARDDRNANVQPWFLPNGARTRLTTGNKVRLYVHARDYWSDLAADLDGVQDASTDFVFTSGWEYGTDLGVPCKRGGTLEAVVRDIADGSKIAVRVLMPRLRDVNKPTNVFTEQNVKMHDLVAGLKNGGACFDPFRYLVGTHHQKMVVLSTGGELVAYAGGIDLHPYRTNWTDAQYRVTGPAAFDLYQSFFERWMAVPDNVVKGRRDPGPTVRAPRPPVGPPDPTTVYAQVWRTYAKKSLNNDGYAFAPEGERTIYQGLVNAIKRTRKFIYLQDQYLIAATPMHEGPDIAGVLADKIREPNFVALVVLIARTEAINAEMYQAWRRRREFIQRLQAASADKVIVCQYRTAAGTQIDYVSPGYVHAKTWIFDDALAWVGSANCNRRGYTHDGEIGTAVYDVVENGDRIAAPREFRIAQWLRALNEPSPGVKRSTANVKREDILDFVNALPLWRNPASDSAIEPYTLGPDKSNAKNPNPDRPVIVVRQLSDDRSWNDLLDPDGS